ncbi:MAG: DUF6768 family protein [Planctomycetota bacterium]
MSEFDDDVKRALRAGHKLEIEGEIDSVRSLVTEIFRFRSSLIAVSSVVKIAAFWAFAVVAAVFTILAEDDRSRLLWGLAALFSAVGVGILWNFHWMMLNRNAVLRELKRIELQIADLAQRAP